MNLPASRQSAPISSPLSSEALPREAFDPNKTLLELKREKFQNPSWDFHRFPTGFSLRKVPLKHLTESDMWMLIRQSIGLDYLISLALDRLEVEPLLKCRHKPGDLLSSVLLADALVWKRNPHYRKRVQTLWKKVSVRLVANEHPEAKMLFSDYRWFLKSVDFLPSN